MNSATNGGVIAGKVFGVIGFILLMLVPLAFPYNFLGDGVYHLVVPKMFFLRLAAAAFVISLAFRLIFEPGVTGRFLGSTWPALAWLGWQAASFIWTDYAWATTEAVMDDACVVACLLGAVMFLSGRSARGFAGIAFGITVMIAGIVFMFFPGKDGHAPFVNENPGGMFFALSAVAAAGWFLSAMANLAAGRRAPLAGIAFAVALMLFSIACVVKSHSTGAAIALAVGAVVLVVVAWKERMIVLTAALIFMLAFLGLILAAPAIKEDMLGQKYQSTAWTRVFIWRGALRMIYERPVLGRGAGTFMEENVENQPVESYMHAGIKSPAEYAHSFYLETAAETGAAGVAVFLGVVVFVLHRARRAMAREPARRRYAAGLAGAAFVALTQGGVDIVMSMASSQIFFWLCAAAVMGMGMRTEDSVPKTGGLRWISAAALSACALAVWAAFFSGELRREVNFVSWYNKGELNVHEISPPYETRNSLFMHTARAKEISDMAYRLRGEPGSRNLGNAERLYGEVAAELSYVQSLAPDAYNTDLNLGYALMNRGRITGDDSQIAEGCRMLVRHLRRNPFNIPEKGEPVSQDAEIFRALKDNLKDPALKREVRDIIANALALVEEGGQDVPQEALNSAEQLADYLEFLAKDPDLIEHR